MFNYDFVELEQLKIARVTNDEYDCFDTYYASYMFHKENDPNFREFN